MSQKRFLIEIGTEEIPARMMSDALDRLDRQFRGWLDDHQYDRVVDGDYEIEVLGTPRRLVLHGELPATQPDETVTEKGPPEHVAYEDGEPTRALEGFCDQHGVSPEAVEVRDLDGGTYTMLEIEKDGRPTPELLSEDLESLILELPWPKSMRWESSNVEFVRPIRWLVAYWDDEPLDVEVGPVSSSTETRGLRFSNYERIDLTGLSDYFDSIGDAEIVLDPADRRETILKGAKTLAAEVDGQPHLPDDLVDEVNFLVESPAPFRGAFDEEFLTLPAEVLEEAMIAHQKYFPVRSDDGLKPYFIGVRNGDEDGLETVRRGNEKVIRARLSDAVFFYEKDLETDYECYREQLKGVVFEEELGSLHAKTERLASAVEMLDGVPSSLETIARHCKNDHVTEIVGEFPKLQGVMGRIYAGESGWDPEDAAVIEQHYRPRGRDDELPSGERGQWLALLDRLDTLVGFFALGHRVSGSSDPYGLRRDALGLLRIVVAGEPEIDLDDVVNRVADLYPDMIDGEQDEVLEDLKTFLRERLFHLFRDETDGFNDEIKAVLARFWSRPGPARRRIHWLVDWRDTEVFDDLYTTAHRIGKMTADVEETEPDQELFETAEEEALFEQYEATRKSVEEAIKRSNSNELLRELADLRDPTDAFFDEVMVMADDEELRENRLALLRTVRTLFDRVADFTHIERDSS